MTNPKCSCGAPLICFSELAGRDELLSAAKDAVRRLDAIADFMNGTVTDEDILRAYQMAYSGDQRQAIKLAESRHPVEVAK